MSNDNHTPSVLSSEAFAAVIDATGTLLAHMTGRGKTELPKTIAECSSEQVELVLGRTLNAIKQYRKAESDKLFAGAREGVAKLITERRGAGKRAYDKLVSIRQDPEMAAVMPAPKETIEVPFSDLSDLFPKGMTEGEIHKFLTAEKYDVVRNGKAKEAKLAVSVKLNPPAPPAPPVSANAAE